MAKKKISIKKLSMSRIIEFINQYGTKVLFFLFFVELQIISFIWISKKIEFGAVHPGFFLLNLCILIPYIINNGLMNPYSRDGKWALFKVDISPSKRTKEDLLKTSSYEKAFEFISTIIFWGINRIIDWLEMTQATYSFLLLLSVSLVIISNVFYMIIMKKKSKSIIFFTGLFIIMMVGLISVVIIIPKEIFSVDFNPVNFLIGLIFYLLLIIIYLISEIRSIRQFRSDIKNANQK